MAPEAESIFLGEVVRDSGVETVSDVDSRTYRLKVKELIRGTWGRSYPPTTRRPGGGAMPRRFPGPR
ncbi:hypothetical protein OG730_40090 [Streptomyces sp. NBC_01298]|uniref:hypothetical protein n=1 Tax=Streptomyces sp. NBC_01298 TaxID=2903817 RepID=UPI002E149011|nr:hypothetical protein OG730_40090 [Streptomyces sp. NBC_01298]